MFKLEIMWERLNPGFNYPEEELKTFENVGKGENSGNQHFLFFLQCFLQASSSGLFKPGNVLLALSSMMTTQEAFCVLCRSRSDCTKCAL